MSYIQAGRNPFIPGPKQIAQWGAKCSLSDPLDLRLGHNQRVLSRCVGGEVQLPIFAKPQAESPSGPCVPMSHVLSLPNVLSAPVHTLPISSLKGP